MYLFLDKYRYENVYKSEQGSECKPIQQKSKGGKLMLGTLHHVKSSSPNSRLNQLTGTFQQPRAALLPKPGTRHRHNEQWRPYQKCPTRKIEIGVNTVQTKILNIPENFNSSAVS
jgi:hypothetical protein